MDILRRILGRKRKQGANRPRRRRLRIEPLENRDLLATLAVNSTGDLGDNNLGDAICATGGLVGGEAECTLRAAIEQANALAGADMIEFDIPGGGPHSLAPASAFPPVLEAVVIDGTTQPGYAGTPRIHIIGSGAGAGARGLTIHSGGSTVRGLAINRFSGDGIRLVTGGGNTIQQNVIGANPAGTTDLGNGSHGVHVFNSPNNVIGGSTASEGNLISGNSGHGVYITRSGSTSNNVDNNLIGLGFNGQTPIGNSGAGVRIDQGASNNNIGGTGNVISANGTSGVLIVGAGSTNNTISGNKIGTDATGQLERGNGGSGVSINSAPGNKVGVPGNGNLISGNALDGVFITAAAAAGNWIQGNTIGLNATGTAAKPNGQAGVSITNSPNNLVGGSAVNAGNVISGNSQSGIFTFGGGASGNKIEGNLIGVNSAGASAIANGQFGVLLRSAPNNTVGGAVAGSGNVISGNTKDGVGIVFSGASGNVVIGNRIGTDASGTADVGNGASGVLIWKAPGNRLGGLTAAERNVVSGNDLFGVRIATSLATGTVVQGNFIGTNASGTAALPNSDSGVQLANAQSTIVGGGAAGARNVISGNGNLGVVLVGAGTTGNNLQGNFIGTDATGASALGNASSGIRIIGGAHGNTVGGDSTLGEGNVISANGGNGVALFDAATHNNVVAGNKIGTQIDGVSPLGNTGQGVRISHASDNVIGGSAPGAANVIAHNTGAGVAVEGTALGNAIQRNSMFSNVGLGIDLNSDAVTANDTPGGSEDSDAGPNLLQNKPVLAGALLSGTDLQVTYSVPSKTAHSAYPLSLEFFLADAAGEEGRTFLGSETYATAEALGIASATIDVTGLGVSVGSKIVATATAADGNTSEFSTSATTQPPYETFFDFGTTVSPLSAGFTRVSNASVYTAGQGFGWTAGTIYAGDRGTTEVTARDFNFTVNGSFAVDLPNGSYQVDLLLGDMSYAHDQVGVYLEGTQVAIVSTQAGEVRNERFEVVVSDGQLTLRLTDLGGADAYAVIEGLRIFALGTIDPVSNAWWPAREGISNAIFTPASQVGFYKYYTVDTTYQAGTNNIRVLLPNNYDPQQEYPIIYVLPVELGNKTQFGDGLTTVYSHGLHQTRDAIFVAPSFSYHPWYADHATSQSLWQETYFKQVIVPFVEEQYPVWDDPETPQPDGRLLLGFSKSGYGAVAMMLRDPDYFGSVVAWDSPLGMTNPSVNAWGYLNVLGTYQNFYDNYQVTSLVETHGQYLVGGPPRIFLQGYSYDFTYTGHQTVHNLMTSHGVPHTYDPGTYRAHVWHSGWVPGAVDALLASI